MEPRRSTIGSPLTALLIDCAALVLPVSARGGRFRLAACASRTHERTQARTRAVAAGALLRKSKVNKYARGGSLGDEQVWRDTSGLPGSNPPILHTTIFMEGALSRDCGGRTNSASRRTEREGGKISVGSVEPVTAADGTF